MGKRNKPPKLKGFEKVLATLPEYEGFRGFASYNLLCAQEGELQDYLELLFKLLKQFGTAAPSQWPLFYSLLNPAFCAQKDNCEMFYQNVIEEELPSAVDSCLLSSIVCAIYHKLVKTGYGTPTQQAAIRQRFELLKSFLYEDGELPEDLMDDWLKTITVTKQNVGDFDENATASEIFEHLTFALSNDMSHIAHEIIGGLRYTKKKFPAGDPEFLHALVYLKDNSAQALRRAIEYLNKLPQDYRLCNQAQGMQAEAHARLGDIEYFEQIVPENQNYISALSMRSYLQLLINNLDLADVSEARLEAVFQRFYQRYTTGPELEDRNTPSHQYSVPLQQCKENALRALKEVYGFYTQVVCVDPAQETDDALPASVSRAQLLLRLSAKDMLDALMTLIRDNNADCRHQFLWHWFRVTPDQDDTVYARQMGLLLEAARSINTNEEFVDAFLADLNYICQTKGLDLEYWLAEAYRAAIACDHPEQEQICAQLQKLCPDTQTVSMQDRVYQKVRSYLREHEQLLYSAAETAYRKAKKESEEYGWKDCGMVSLNFFRILEVELRDRIFVKAFGSEESKALIDEFSRKLKPHVLEWEMKVQQGENASKVRSIFRARIPGSSPFDFPRTIDALRKPENLDLGSMWYCFCFLLDTCRIAEQWQPYQQAMRQMVYDVLTEEGIQAIQDGQLESTISYRRREQYRNPPAHARYLPFDKAAECREHVNETLLTLHQSWLKKA